MAKRFKDMRPKSANMHPIDLAALERDATDIVEILLERRISTGRELLAALPAMPEGHPLQ